MQVFYDETGKFDSLRIPSEQVIPYWTNSEHKELDAVIRFYELYNVTTQETIYKAEFWLTEGKNEQGGVYFYEIINGLVRLIVQWVTMAICHIYDKWTRI